MLLQIAVATSVLLGSSFALPGPASSNNDQLPFPVGLSPGPVMAQNFPDPSIIFANGMWHSFATRSINSSVHIQAATSPDFVHWTLVTNSDGSEYDALPTLAPWINPEVNDANTWAPDVSQLDDGRFIMYYCATTAVDTSKHCVSAAYAETVLGPYTPIPDTLYCPLEQGGAIDPAGFYEVVGPQPPVFWTGPSNGPTRRWVVYKVDGGSIGHGGPCGNDVTPVVPTPLVLQEVDPRDGITPIGGNYTLLNNNGLADQGVIEAPNLIRAPDGTYILFFSSGCFATTAYTVSYATARSITGPYYRHPSPLLQTGNFGLTGPGGMSVRIADDYHAVFHADNSTEYLANQRLLHTARLGITPGGIVFV